MSGLNSGTFILRDDKESKLIESEPESLLQSSSDLIKLDWNLERFMNVLLDFESSSYSYLEFLKYDLNLTFVDAVSI